VCLDMKILSMYLYVKMSESYICEHCGVEAAAGAEPPASCAICADDRVNATGVQRWTTIARLAETHRAHLQAIEPHVLTGIAVAPTVGIGQRAILVEVSDGCVLFDCIPFIDDTVVRYIEQHGGLKAIVPSHPHFYGAMVSWSDAFGGVPIYVHEMDRAWVQRQSATIRFWQGDLHALHDGLTMLRCGGHFDGGTVLHVAQGSEGKGSLLGGDIVMVTENGRGVSFMRSYPGYIPLYRSQIEHIAGVLRPFAYERVYGPWWDRVIETGGSTVVADAAARHLKVLTNARGCPIL
jgi:glyoxylase-like metal-dependent hydrolase (beta-lactamase superfamily II)